MTRHYGFVPRGIAAALALAAAAACADMPNQPPAPGRAVAGETAEDTIPGTGQDSIVAPPAELDRAHENEFEKIAAQVPEFGGYFYDESGTRVTVLTDLAAQERADAVIGAEAARLEQSGHQEDQVSSGRTAYVQGRFSFPELQKYRDASLDPAFAVEGTEFIDLDERLNRVTIGLSNEAARPEVEAGLARAGVPLEAVHFEATKPVEQSITLRDNNRVLQGGLQIAFGNSLCTLGFITTWSTSRAFVTNSHCSNSIWSGGDGTKYYQATTWGGNYVGYEISDPGSWWCNWPFWKRCRFSDANIVRVPSFPTALGKIARTTGWALGPWASGSITIDPLNPQFQIVAEQPWPYVGQYLDKVGRTSGWTYGRVTRTCVDTNVAASNRRVLCQDFALYGSQPGDSGSPVFVWYGSTVKLAGINWGSNGYEAVFSAMWNIEFDLGPRTTF